MDDKISYSIENIYNIQNLSILFTFIAFFLIVLFLFTPLRNYYFLYLVVKIIIIVLLLLTFSAILLQIHNLRKKGKITKELEIELQNQMITNLYASYIYLFIFGLVIIYIIKKF